MGYDTEDFMGRENTFKNTFMEFSRRATESGKEKGASPELCALLATFMMIEAGGQIGSLKLPTIEQEGTISNRLSDYFSYLSPISRDGKIILHMPYLTEEKAIEILKNSKHFS